MKKQQSPFLYRTESSANRQAEGMGLSGKSKLRKWMGPIWIAIQSLRDLVTSCQDEIHLPYMIIVAYCFFCLFYISTILNVLAIVKQPLIIKPWCTGL